MNQWPPVVRCGYQGAIELAISTFFPNYGLPVKVLKKWTKYWRQILSALNSKHQQFHFFSHGLHLLCFIRNVYKERYFQGVEIWKKLRNLTPCF